MATRLPKFDRPVLIAWAPEDRFFKVALGERLATTFPDARLVRIPDAAHVRGARPAGAARGGNRFVRRGSLRLASGPCLE